MTSRTLMFGKGLVSTKSNNDAHHCAYLTQTILRAKNVIASPEAVLHVEGCQPKLISSEFRPEFRSKLISTFDEIIGRNYRNFDFDGRNRNSDKQSK
jgi:hypothetical protein